MIKNLEIKIVFCILWVCLLISCSYEGKEVYHEDGICYKIENGKAYVIKAWKGFGTLVIPSEIKLSHKIFSVDGVLPYAFINQPKLSKIEIKDGVRFIDKYAFANCDDLKEVILPNSIKQIGIGSFMGCYYLHHIQLPDSLIIIEDSTFYNSGLFSIQIPNQVVYVGNSAFEKNLFLEQGTLYLPKSLDSIGNYAFSMAPGISSILFPSNLKKIGEGAFLYDRSLGAIYIPDKLKTIGDYAFGGCTIDEIKVSSNNEYFKIKGGCLVDSLEKRLITITLQACCDGTLRIPIGIEELGYYAISNYLDYGYWSFRKLILPETIKKVNRRSIVISSHWLNEFVIPSSVEIIEDGFIDVDFKFREIKVNSRNKFFKEIDGVIYDKECKRLVYYSSSKMNKDFEIPSSVRTIDYGAFSRSKHLEKLNTGENVHRIHAIGIDENIKRIELIGIDSLNENDCVGHDGLTYVFSDKIKYLHCSNFRGKKKIICYASTPPFIDGVPKNERWNKNLHHLYVKPEDLSNYQNNEYLQELFCIHMIDSKNK